MTLKTKFDSKQLQKITELFNQDYGSRKIALILKVNRSTIIRAYKQLGLDSSSKKTPCFAYKVTEKCCKICNSIKLIDQFRKRIKGTRISYETYCLNCEKEYNKQNGKINYKIHKEKRKQYKEDNKDKIRKYMKDYSSNYRKNRMKSDIEFRMRCTISTAIYVELKKFNSYKSGGCWKSLNYSPKDLKNHLELQFEPWMTWKNHGRYYSKIWDNNDQSTWTWQLDHIIPQSDLPYANMTDENFKKCWALKNLRPLSAKQNYLDGINKTRHIKQL